jgi:hypothetical protein
MATTTPNYGWAVPTSTDLVKDGATAIETLGDAIDASMNTALGTKKAGMVLLNTTSFSGVTTQSFNNVFSSTYDNYRILLKQTTSGGGALTLRLRASGSDTSTNYASQRISAQTTSLITTQNASGTDEFFIAQMEASGAQDGSVVEATFFAPNLATKTGFIGWNSAITNDPYVNMSYNCGIHNASTQFDGFTLIAGGNMGGTISIYGFNK